MNGEDARGMRRNANKIRNRMNCKKEKREEMEWSDRGRENKTRREL